MKRHSLSVSELRKQANELYNKARKAAGIESRKPMRVQRQEANLVRRELKHDSMMTTKQRSRAEKVRQTNLKAKREHDARVKRVGEILAGLPETEKKTELGIVLPSGSDIGAVLSRVRE